MEGDSSQLNDVIKSITRDGENNNSKKTSANTISSTKAIIKFGLKRIK
jgi:hypothetical protein